MDKLVNKAPNDLTDYRIVKLSDGSTLVGSISLGKTPQETLEALRITKASIFNNLDAAQNRLKTNAFFAKENDGLYLIAENNNIINYLSTGVLPSTKYSSGYEGQSAIRKITLEE